MLRRPEKYYPLRVVVCGECWLVQAEAYSRASELFNEEYAYFSSFSTAWLRHAETFARKAVRSLGLDSSSRVVEVASNDGYLLQYFQKLGIPCFGIEPTASTADVARQRGLDIVQDFLTARLARQIRADQPGTDLLVANNVLAHVPDLRDFVEACRILLNSSGVASFEFPHLMNLVEKNQFDTVYHEHFYYFSLQTVLDLFTECGLRLIHVEQIETHGGSLRIWATPLSSDQLEIGSSVERMISREQQAQVRSADYYRKMQHRAETTKHCLLEYLLHARRTNRVVVGYGAAAKGNTLLNFAGVRSDLLPFVVDKSPHKQGKYLPGSRIAVREPAQLMEGCYDDVVVFPWNIKDEIAAELRQMGCKVNRLVTFIPEREFELLRVVT